MSLRSIERGAFDERNFVKKAVNRALRNLGQRNHALNQAARACAEFSPRPIAKAVAPVVAIRPRVLRAGSPTTLCES